MDIDGFADLLRQQNREKAVEALEEMTDEIQKKACAIDKWDRYMVGGMEIMQAVICCAAGMQSIKESDDEKLCKYQSKRLAKRLITSGRVKLTERVDGVLGFASGMDEEVMEKFEFRPEDFEKNFVPILNEKIPSLHLARSLNKIVIYDTKYTDDNKLNIKSTTCYCTTFKTELPKLPTPF